MIKQKLKLDRKMVEQEQKQEEQTAPVEEKATMGKQFERGTATQEEPEEEEVFETNW